MIYNFAADPIQVRMRLWALAPGEYEFTLGPDEDGDGQMDMVDEDERVQVTGPGATVNFELVPGSPYMVQLALESAAEGVPELRPDVALSEGEIKVLPPGAPKGEKVIVAARVHNVGAAVAKEILVRFYEGEVSEEALIKEERLLALGPPARTGQTFAWTHVEHVLRNDETRFIVVAKLVDAAPEQEISVGNNRAAVAYRAGAKANPGFARLFLKGKLCRQLLPVWCELAEEFLGVGSYSLSLARVLELKQAIAGQGATLTAAEQEAARQLQSYLSTLEAELQAKQK